MVNGSFSCMLLETDDAVIGDVITSLRLIEVPVRVARSVDEAKKKIIQKPPSFVMTRLRLGPDTEAGVRLAKDLSASSEYCRIPVVAMVPQSEGELFAGCRECFNAEVALPVTFPAFTKRVQEFLSQFTKWLESAPTDASTAAKTANGHHQGASGDSGALEKRVLGAYAIQLAVLEALKSSDRFTSGRLEDIPAVVSEVTSQICQEIDLKKVLG